MAETSYLQSIVDRNLIHLVRSTLRVFFRSIEVEGAEKLPTGRPLVIVANHFNGLVDPLLLACLPIRPRFLAKSTLWANPMVRPLLSLSAAVPVHRRQDAGEGADLRKNSESFDACARRLAAGETVALFPEGISHSEVALAPLRTGAARIVLETCAAYPGVEPQVVPVGLFFERKYEFRSRALIRVGDPIDSGAERELHASDPRAAVRALTDRIAAGLRSVTMNFESKSEAALVQRVAEFGLSDGEGGRRRSSLSEAFDLQTRALAGCRDLLAVAPERAAAFTAELEEYDSLREAHGIPDEHVAQLGQLHAWRRLIGPLALAPLAVVGTLLNYLPYRAAGLIADRAAESPDLPATFKLFSGFFLLPLAWCAEAALAWHWWGGWPALLTFPLAASSGRVVLYLAERKWEVTAALRTRSKLRSHAWLADDLRSRRARLDTQLREFARWHDEHRASRAGISRA